MIDRTCQQCGKTYQTFPSIRLKYCGSPCASAAKVKAVSVPCAVCGTPFVKRPSRPDAAYCSKSCARTASNLTDANPAFRRDVSGENNPMHGVRRVGESNPMHGKRKELAPRWRGGRKKHPEGYLMVVVPDDHPRPSFQSVTGTKYLLAHRYAMEQHLGRYLEAGEVVHHRDGDKLNNAIENLELFASQSDHIRLGHSSASRTRER